ncbi:MAG: hypothetical protein AAB853_02775 [Patescibacteria group bacterium]
MAILERRFLKRDGAMIAEREYVIDGELAERWQLGCRGKPGERSAVGPHDVMFVKFMASGDIEHVIAPHGVSKRFFELTKTPERLPKSMEDLVRKALGDVVE